ncbi:MAG: glycosyltransferase family 2 protein [Ferruginibacter sp.]
MKNLSEVLPAVSVIIPNYNHAIYLKQRIDSVLQQTCQDFELIILDDCSTDNSRQVIEQYRNNPVVSKIEYNKYNSGSTFKQWEKGLALAKASLVWIAESDDIMDASFLEQAVLKFDNYANLSMVQCGSRWINSEGIQLDTDMIGAEEKLTTGKDFIIANMLFGNEIYNASAVLFKKDKIVLPLARGITGKKYCGDWLFWVKLMEQGNIFRMKENYNQYRRHTQNVSFAADKAGLLFLEGVQVYGYIKKKYASEFEFADHRDKLWAARFAASKPGAGICLTFLINSFQAGFYLPIYTAWLVLTGRSAYKHY